jgi:DNA-binding NtrC family response regulator
METNKRALVADDDVEVAITTSKIISRCYPGVSVDIFTDSEEAAKAISENPKNHYSVFISDIDFNREPKGLGLILLARKKSEKLPIIAHSGNNYNKDMALFAGANYFLVKPYLIEELTGPLDKIFQKK